MSRETNMTVGRPTKLILGLAVPLILTNVGQQLYTVADASIVGRGVGVEALAALGATDWLYWLVLWTVQAMTQGFSVLVSQTFGSNDKKGLRKAITMPVWRQAVILYVATNGLLSDVPLDRVRDFVQKFADSLPDSLLTEIQSTGTLTGTAAEQIREALKTYKDQVSAAWQA